MELLSKEVVDLVGGGEVWEVKKNKVHGRKHFAKTKNFMHSEYRVAQKKNPCIDHLTTDHFPKEKKIVQGIPPKKISCGFRIPHLTI